MYIVRIYINIKLLSVPIHGFTSLISQFMNWFLKFLKQLHGYYSLNQDIYLMKFKRKMSSLIIISFSLYFQDWIY